MPIEEALTVYKQMYDLGNASPIHFGVWLRPFDDSGELANQSIDLISTYDLTQSSQDDNEFSEGQQIPLLDNSILPWLCQSIDLSVFEGQTDSVNVGHYQINQITGNSSGEISIPFLETRNASILNSAKAIKNIMFAKDGTQGLPKDYMMYLTIYMYDKHSLSTRIFEIEHLVALQTSSIPLDVTNKSAASVVTLNFIKMFPML